MPHNSNCARAKRPGCKCECGGARHGCQGGFELASEPKEAVLAYVALQDELWQNRPSQTLTDMQIAIGCSRADVVYWLHRNRTLREHARTTEELAFEDAPDAQDQGLVLRTLAGCLDPERMLEFQAWAARNHFWCELLAQFAYAIAQYERLKYLIPSAVEKALLTRETEPPPDGSNYSETIGIAVHSTWRYLLEAMVAALGFPPATLLMDGEALLWPIRVIAVLMCPDASRHKAVREHCWAPILRHGDAMVRQEVHDRLIQVFPHDRWFTWFETSEPTPATAI